jgi:putative membrane protein
VIPSTSLLAPMLLGAPGIAQADAIPEFSWAVWSGDGTLRAGLLLLAGLYLLGIGPLRRRHRLGPPVSRAKVATYLAGVLALFLVLDGPIHELSDTYLFSAHMVQHMVITLVAPPLLLLGLPGWLVRPIATHRYVYPVARTVTRAIPAALLFNIVFVAYHRPLYYNAVATNHDLHVASHLLFIALATIMWWPLLSPLDELPPLPYPLRMVYVFVQTIPGFLLGTFIVHSTTVLYPFYEAAPRVWGITPLDDQKLGGLIMWVVGGAYLLLIFSAIFFVWAHKENAANEGADAPRRPPSRPDYPVCSEPIALGARHVATLPDKTRLN